MVGKNGDWRTDLIPRLRSQTPSTGMQSVFRDGILRHMCLRSILIAVVFVCACAPPPAGTLVTTAYTASVLYQQRSFSGGSLSGQSILVLPVLTKQGIDTTPALSPAKIGKLLQEARSDVEPVTKEEFETRYSAHHDTASLSSFYRLLFKGNVVALSNSDSIWSEMKTAYCCATRITNAITIKGFNNIITRRMNMETELWDVDSAEVVLRIQVRASARGERITDAEFISSAIRAAFEKLPVFAPSTNEQNW
jgi:hypothetical protein